MSFTEIIGQDRAIDDLKNAYLRNRIPSAYLFAGPQGVGKASTAIILARLLNCLAPRTDAEPCDVCTSCRKITHDNHPDVWSIGPDPALIRKAIKIQQLRELQKLVRFPPQEGKMRVVIVDGVEYMTEEASNAFLKTLEEPPEGNLFVLITSAPSQLLPTILSRCQRVSFVPLQRKPLQNLLVEQHGFDPLLAELAAGISEGSVGSALALDEALSSDTRREFLLAQPALQEQPRGVSRALDLAEKLSKDSGQISLYLTLLRSWYRDLLFLREVAPDREVVLNRDCFPQLKQHASLLPTHAIEQIIQAIEDAEDALRRNAANQLTLERLFLTISQANRLH